MVRLSSILFGFWLVTAIIRAFYLNIATNIPQHEILLNAAQFGGYGILSFFGLIAIYLVFAIIIGSMISHGEASHLSNIKG